MPAVSEKQKKFMDAVAHNKGFAKKVGVPQSVGAEFSDKSKGMKFGSGNGTRVNSQAVNQPKTDHGAMALFKQGGRMATKMNPGMMAIMAKKKSMQEGSKADMASDKKQMMGMKKGGMKMAGGGAMPMKDGKPAFLNDGKGMKKGGMAMKKMAMGGSASKRADGVAVKGKTKGTMMAKGGMSKKYC